MEMFFSIPDQASSKANAHSAAPVSVRQRANRMARWMIPLLRAAPKMWAFRASIASLHVDDSQEHTENFGLQQDAAGGLLLSPAFAQYREKRFRFSNA
jgi:hypothetical protein